MEGQTRWEALKEVLEDVACRDAISFAWPLYFYIVFHGDRQNYLVTNFPSLQKELHVPIPTLKRWKDRLMESKVAQSIAGNHQWTLRLLPPYDTPLTCIKTDQAELLIKSDDKTKSLIRKMFSGDSVGLLPLIAELSHKVERLEQAKSGAR